MGLARIRTSLATFVVAASLAGAADAGAAVVTHQFPFAVGEQGLVIPSGVTSIDVRAVGGRGGSAAATGGFGAAVSGTLAVVPGQTIFVAVGGNGQTAPVLSCGFHVTCTTNGSSAGGFNGGGNIAAAGCEGQICGPSGGGGGASDVRTCSRNATTCAGAAGSLASRLLVAAGGGGSGGRWSVSAAPGGAGGDAGSPGTDGSENRGIGRGGGAGTGSAGGAGSTSPFGSQAASGDLGAGGSGGSSIRALGGGGGGGLFGGGGGGSAHHYGGGGGGGSSLVPPGGSMSTDFTGTPSVTITYETSDAGPHEVRRSYGFNTNEQRFTVPPGVTSINATAIGARGGAVPGEQALGGYGAVVSGALAVAPGQVLYVTVGGNGRPAGTSCYDVYTEYVDSEGEVFEDYAYTQCALEGGGTGGFNGGGDAASGDCVQETCGPAAGGGGATDLRTCSRFGGGTSCPELSAESRLLVAAGGGGAGGRWGTGGPPGGDGGDAGMRGGDGSPSFLAGGGGEPGGDSGPGAGGVGAGAAGSPGALGAGGTGGHYPRATGGGGGGGRFGGGGGGSGAHAAGGGGGGSNLVPAGGDATVDSTGASSMTLSWVVGDPDSIDVSLAPASIRANGTATSIATATLKDANGAPVPGETVAFSSSDGGIQIGATVDNGDGTYSAQITASTTPGQATITASSGTLSDGALLTQTDSTPPEVTITSPVAAGAGTAGRYPRHSVVIADYACTDADSGIASCAGPADDGAAIDTSTIGSHDFEVVAVDAAGNTTRRKVSYVVTDTTGPLVTIGTPAEGATYPRGTVVAADYGCVDEPGGSGVATCNGSLADGNPIDTSTSGARTFEVVGMDVAGNRTTRTVSYTIGDDVRPQVSISAPLSNATFARGQVVPAGYACSDEAGGSGLASCAGPVADGAPIDTSTLGGHSFQVTARDTSGNTAQATVTYTVADTTPPEVSIATPLDGATFARGQIVAASYTCSDEAGGTGVASCTGPVPSGIALDTSRPGAHTFEVTAVDGAGNTRSRSARYTVAEPSTGSPSGGGAGAPDGPPTGVAGGGRPSTRFSGIVVVVETGLNLSCAPGEVNCLFVGTATAGGSTASASRRRARPMRIGSARVSVAAGATRALKLRLTRAAAKRLLRNRRLRITVTVRGASGTQPLATTRRSFTVRPPRRP